MTSKASHDPAPRGIRCAAWARLTHFQRQVYRATCAIPRGETRSYRWVAERIGRPRAARPVGQALRRNPCLRRDAICTFCGVPHHRRRGRQAFAPIVPCHRVVRSDGALGGYARGPARKRLLLQQEGWHDKKR